MLDIRDNKLLHTNALLTDLAGKVLSVTAIKAQQQYISLSGLAAGVYLLKLEGMAAIRIVKEQE